MAKAEATVATRPSDGSRSEISQAEGLRECLAEMTARLDRLEQARADQDRIIDALLASPDTLKAVLRRQVRQPGPIAANDCARLIAGLPLTADRLKMIAELERAHLRQNTTLKILFARALAARFGAGTRERAAATVLEMQAQRMRQAFASVARLYEHPARAEISQGLHDRGAAEGIHLMVANALMRMGRLEEARDFAAARLAENPGQLSLEAFLARVQAVEDPDQAIESLKTLVRRKRYKDPSATILLAELLIQKGHFKTVHDLIARRRRGGEERDLHLALANRAAARNAFAAQKEAIDAFFGMQRLWSPAPAEGPFRLDRTAPVDLPPIERGPLVSVVMTAFDAQAHMETSIRSVLAQTYRNLELIVVDDSSRDGTREIVSRLAEEDGRVRPLFRADNAGTYVAKNEGLGLARGELLTCHDSDDWWHPQHLAAHVEVMTAEPELAATRSQWARVDEEGRFVLKPWGGYSHSNPASAMYTRAVLETVGLFDSVRTGADTELWNRVAASFGAHAVRTLTRTLAIGLHHGRSLTTSGEARFDDFGVSLARLAYCEAWSRWQVETLSEGARLHMPFPLDHRLFDLPATSPGT